MNTFQSSTFADEEGVMYPDNDDAPLLVKGNS
jgi:hypothetical protein